MTTPGSTTPARERGGCLSLLLILYIIGGVLDLFLAFSIGGANAVNASVGAPLLPSWYPIALIISAILALVGVYGMFTWKKWGVYLIIAELVIGLVVSLLTGQSVGTAVVSALIGGGLLWYLLRDKWTLFEG